MTEIGVDGREHLAGTQDHKINKKKTRRWHKKPEERKAIEILERLGPKELLVIEQWIREWKRMMVQELQKKAID